MAHHEMLINPQFLKISRLMNIVILISIIKVSRTIGECIVGDTVICDSLKNIDCEQAKEWTHLKIVNSTVASNFQCPMNKLTTLIAENAITGWNWRHLPRNLVNLHVSKSDLGTVQKYLIPRLNFKMLSLVNNGIERIEEKAFAYPNILVLDLSGNEISKIYGEQTFAKNPTRELNLQHNKLSVLQGVVFSPTIKILLLDHNNLITLPNLNSYNLLETLSVSNNKLKTLSNFNELTSLRQLDLSHNELFLFGGEEIEHLKKLAVLNLSHNEISTINLNFLTKSINKDFSLYLNHNHFQYVDLSTIKNRTVYYYTKLTLYGNPFNCKCLYLLNSFFKENQRILRSQCEKSLFNSGTKPICYEFNTNKCEDSSYLPDERLIKFKRAVEDYPCDSYTNFKSEFC